MLGLQMFFTFVINHEIHCYAVTLAFKEFSLWLQIPPFSACIPRCIWLIERETLKRKTLCRVSICKFYYNGKSTYKGCTLRDMKTDVSFSRRTLSERCRHQSVSLILLYLFTEQQLLLAFYTLKSNVEFIKKKSLF